jgi:cell division protein FtsB
VEIFGEAKKGSYIYDVNKKIIKVMKNTKIEKLELENSKLEDQISKLRQETRTEVSSFFKKHYFPFVNRIQFDHDDYFRLYDKEGNEICTLSLRGDTYRDPKPTHIVIGYYSSQAKSDNNIELDRLNMLGMVSKIVKNDYKEIIEYTRSLSMKNKNSIKRLNKQSWELEKEISQLEKEDRENKKLESLNKLFKGVNIKKQSIHVRHDYRISEVKKIKFLNWTNDNKKSLTIELTYEQFKWNQDGNHTVEDRTDVYNKVRLDNINYIINGLENEIVK